jgi:hypothetical protein
MDAGRSKAWITTLKEVGLNLKLSEATEYGHLYGEKFFSAIEKNLANFESDLSKAFESRWEIFDQKKPILRLCGSFYQSMGNDHG